MVFPTVLAFLLLASPVDFCYCSSFCLLSTPRVSAVNVPGVPAVVRVSILHCSWVAGVTVVASFTTVVNMPSAYWCFVPPPQTAVLGILYCSSCLLCCFLACWWCIFTAVVSSLDSLLWLESLLLLLSLLVLVLFCYWCFQLSWRTCCCWLHCCCWRLCYCWLPCCCWLSCCFWRTAC